MEDRETVRCPHCARPDVRVTRDGFLAAHRHRTSSRWSCNGGGMSAQLAREAADRQAAVDREAADRRAALA